LRYCGNFVRILQDSQLWALAPQALKLGDALLAMRKIGFGAVENGCKEHDFDCYALGDGEDYLSGRFDSHAVNATKKLLPLCVKSFREKCTHKGSQGAFSS